jgi:hypothetical protein
MKDYLHEARTQNLVVFCHLLIKLHFFTGHTLYQGCVMRSFGAYTVKYS